MGELKNSKILHFLKSNLKTCSMPTNINNLKFKTLSGQLSIDKLNLNQITYLNLLNSGF